MVEKVWRANYKNNTVDHHVEFNDDDDDYIELKANCAPGKSL